MKFSIDDILKNPILIMIVLVTASCMSLFITHNYASVEYLEKRISEAKESVNKENGKVSDQITELRLALREMDKNVDEIYRIVKYQEGKNER